MKKFVSILLPIILCVVGLLTLSSCTDKGDLWIEEATIDAVVNENGDLIVSERWDVKTSSSEGYRNLYRTINTYDSKFKKASELVFSGAENNDTGKAFPVEEKITDMESDSAYEYNVSHYKNTS